MEAVKVISLLASTTSGEPRAGAFNKILFAGCPLEVLALSSVVSEIGGREQTAAPVTMVCILEAWKTPRLWWAWRDVFFGS